LPALTAFAGLVASLLIVAAFAPNPLFYGVALFGIGLGMMFFYTSAITIVQLCADDSIRGRVMGLYTVVYIGSAALGGPLVGWLDEEFGPRVGMVFAGAVPAVVTLVVGFKLVRQGHAQLAGNSRAA
jgi:MFS family permease